MPLLGGRAKKRVKPRPWRARSCLQALFFDSRTLQETRSSRRVSSVPHRWYQLVAARKSYCKIRARNRNIIDRNGCRPPETVSEGRRTKCLNANVSACSLFSDISERNNDYSDTLDSRRGEVGVVTFFVLKVPDYESAMLIYFYIYICK